MASFRLSPRDRWGMLQSVTFTYFIIYFCFFRNTLFEYSSSGRNREIPLVRRFVRFFKGIDFFHEYFVTAKPIYGCKKKRKKFVPAHSSPRSTGISSKYFFFKTNFQDSKFLISDERARQFREKFCKHGEEKRKEESTHRNRASDATNKQTSEQQKNYFSRSV